MNKLYTLIIGFLLMTSLMSGCWLASLTASSGEGVVLYLEPDIMNVEPGQIFKLNVRISNVQNLYKWTLSLSWNPSVIELEPASTSAVSEEPFLKNAGPTHFAPLPYTARSGYLSYISCELRPPTSASGDGVLFNVCFKVIAEGETTVTIGNSVLYNYFMQKISHTCKQGYVSSKSVFHDIAVSLEAPKTLVLGESTLLNVTIANKGETDETGIMLKLLINNSLYKIQNLTLLRKREIENRTYPWTPQSKGSYNITACITPKPFETNLANNYDNRMVNVVELIHDIAVSLEVPNKVVKGESVDIKVNVRNVGAYDEAYIVVSISVNGATMNERTIASLTSGSNKTFTDVWAPDSEGAYVITVFVNTVNGETIIYNNRVSKTVNVVASSKEQRQILIVADDDGQYYCRGTSLYEFEHALQLAGYSYDVWNESTRGRPTVNHLLSYELVIWTCGDSWVRPIDDVDASTLIQYLSEGGSLLIEGQKIAFEAEPEFRSEVLHVSLIGYVSFKPPTGMLVVKKHSITDNLPTNITCFTKPNWTDRVSSSNGAYAVLQYYGEDTEYFDSSYYNTTAVNVFDGVEKGSTIYYAFSLFNIPEYERQLLVKNCVNWLLRNDISTIGVGLINAPERSVHFIYPDPVSLTVNDTFGIVAGATVYGLCKLPQEQGFVTNKDWIASGKINPARIDDAIVVLSGNPKYHETIRTYENEGLTPVRFYENQTHFMLLNSKRNTIVSVSKKEVVNRLDDAFVIYTFTEGKTRFLVIYGLGWRSTWDASLFFVDIVSKNFMQYTQTVYIARWDSTANRYFKVSFP